MEREKAEDVATERLQLIAPLLDPHVDQATRQQLTMAIGAQSGISDRTVRRYVAQFQAVKFEGLKLRSRVARGSDAIPPAVLAEAV